MANCVKGSQAQIKPSFPLDGLLCQRNEPEAGIKPGPQHLFSRHFVAMLIKGRNFATMAPMVAEPAAMPRASFHPPFA